MSITTNQLPSEARPIVPYRWHLATYQLFNEHPSDKPILDIGCGMGAAVPVLNAFGVRKYHGIDPSLESIEFCRRTWPWLTFEQGEIRAVGKTYPESFGGFISSSMLMHIPRSEIYQALKSLRKSLVTGSRGMIETGAMQCGIGTLERGGLSITLYSDVELVTALELNNFRIDHHRLSGLMQVAIVTAC